MSHGEFRRRYKLPGVRQANGPASKVILQSDFEGISKAVSDRKVKTRRRAVDEFWW